MSGASHQGTAAHQRAPELQLIVVGERPGDAGPKGLTVDGRAVGRAEIRRRHGRGADLELQVATRQRTVVDVDIAAGVAPQLVAPRAKRPALPRARPAGDDELAYRAAADVRWFGGARDQ